jgi:hypothetical protein
MASPTIGIEVEDLPSIHQGLAVDRTRYPGLRAAVFSMIAVTYRHEIKNGLKGELMVEKSWTTVPSISMCNNYS